MENVEHQAGAQTTAMHSNARSRSRTAPAAAASTADAPLRPDQCAPAPHRVDLRVHATAAPKLRRAPPVQACLLRPITPALHCQRETGGERTYDVLKSIAAR